MATDQGQPGKQRLLVICRQTLLREGVRLLLGQEEEWQVEAATSLAGVGQEGDCGAMPAPSVALVVDDFAEPQSAEVVRQLQRCWPGLPILALSSGTQPQQVQAALAAGVAGYLPLDASPDELIWAVGAAGRGELVLHPSLLPALVAHIIGQEEAEPTASLDALSPREREVLGGLVRGLSDRDIAQELFISVRTVQSHLAHIYEKLGVHSRTEAAVLAVRAQASGQWSPGTE